MDRERTADAPGAETTPGPGPAELSPLIALAHAAEGAERFVAAGRVNDLLIAMRRPGNEAAEAKAILAALDVSQLDGLVDGTGRDCRKEAVETLLACGFPHALEVRPEDLAHARGTPAVRPVTAREDGPPAPLVKLGGWLALLVAVWQLGTASNLFRFVPTLALILVAGAAMTGYAGQKLVNLKANESLAMVYVCLFGGVLAHFGLMAIGDGSFPYLLAALSAISAVLVAVGKGMDSDGT